MAFQDDAFQNDAFQTGLDLPDEVKPPAAGRIVIANGWPESDDEELMFWIL